MDKTNEIQVAFTNEEMVCMVMVMDSLAQNEEDGQCVYKTIFHKFRGSLIGRFSREQLVAAMQDPIFADSLKVS